MQRRFRQVDVFAAEAYAGNPVAVVLDGEDLDLAEMVRFTRWMNLSEATFLQPARDQTADYRVRIITSASDTAGREAGGAELPFAGHPTLGTCHAWLEAGGRPKQADRIIQECGAGLVPILATDHGLAFAAPSLRRSGPVEEPLVEHIARVLRIDRGEIRDAAWVDNGPGWVAVLLESAERVLALEPGFVDLDLGVVGPYPSGSQVAFEVRAFFPSNGATVEDPVTGSLNASLALWLRATHRATIPYVASQGTALGRRGLILISEDDEKTIWVCGATRTCVSGVAEL